MLTALPSELFAILAAGALCGLWVLFQVWIARVDPENQGVRGSCGACSGGTCHGGCDAGEGGGVVEGEVDGPGGDGNVLAGRFGKAER